MIWAGVVIASLGCYLEKVAGHLLPRSVLERDAVRQVAALLPVALLAALVAVQTFATGQTLQLDARVVAVAVAVVALALRAPFLLVVLIASVTAALLRAGGILP